MHAHDEQPGIAGGYRFAILALFGFGFVIAGFLFVDLARLLVR